MVARCLLVIVAVPLFLACASAHAAPRSNAASYLDARVAEWMKAPPPVANVACTLSCHTSFASLIARKHLDAVMPATDAARTAIEERVRAAVRDDATPFYGTAGSSRARQSRGTESVLNATALILDDRGTQSEIATTAIAQMWSTQRSDGGWDWLDFGLKPWEAGEDWGLAMAALAAGNAPDASRVDNVKRLARLVERRLGSTRLPVSLHDRAALLWASGSLRELLPRKAIPNIASAIAATQRADGGFSWMQHDEPSDGYSTALAVLALCHGTADGNQREDVRRGLEWLLTHQRRDGSWPGRSTRDGASDRAQTFATDAATGYAVLALATCKPNRN